MNFFKANLPPSRVPTLTEVVDFVSVAEPTVVDASDPVNADPVPTTVSVESTAPMVAAPQATDSTLPDLPTQDELVHQVLSDVQRQIDVMLEYRMKEALAPVITRLTDALFRDARAELAVVLKDVVTRAVDQEIAKRQAK